MKIVKFCVILVACVVTAFIGTVLAVYSYIDWLKDQPIDDHH